MDLPLPLMKGIVVTKAGTTMAPWMIWLLLYILAINSNTKGIASCGKGRGSHYATE